MELKVTMKRLHLLDKVPLESRAKVAIEKHQNTLTGKKLLNLIKVNKANMLMMMIIYPWMTVFHLTLRFNSKLTEKTKRNNKRKMIRTLLNMIRGRN